MNDLISRGGLRMFLPILFRYLPKAYQLLSGTKLLTPSWYSTTCWSCRVHIPYFLDLSQWNLCMFSHQWLAQEGCHFKDGWSACVGMCRLQRIPWTSVEICLPHPPPRLCPTWTYDLLRAVCKGPQMWKLHDNNCGWYAGWLSTSHCVAFRWSWTLW